MLELEQEQVYTTDVVTTVRFTVRHIGRLDPDQIRIMIPEVLSFDYLLGQDDYPSVQAYNVISDEVEYANTPEAD